MNHLNRAFEEINVKKNYKDRYFIYNSMNLCINNNVLQEKIIDSAKPG